MGVTLPVKSRRRRFGAVVATVFAAGFVGCFTLGSGRVDPDAVPVSFTCLFGCNVEGVRDLLSNILLFLPLGWALQKWMKPFHVLLLCLVVSLGIEGLQATVIVGRDSSLRDVIGNTAGGALGAWLAQQWRWLRWPDSTWGRRLATAASIAWLVLVLLSGWGVQVAVSDRTWYGSRAPTLGQYAVYQGTVLSVDLNGWSPPDSNIPEPVPLRTAMRSDSFLLTVRAVSGSQPPGPAPIFLVADGHRPDQLLVAQDRRRLLLHLRSRFDSWEMRGVMAALPRFPGRTPGDTVQIVGGMIDRHLVFKVASDSGDKEVRLPLTVGWAWVSLAPFLFPVWNEWVVFNSLWLGVLILPAGYWLGRTEPRRGLLLAFLVVASGLFLGAKVTAAAPTSWYEWVGTGLGALWGWFRGFRSRRYPAWTPRSEP